MIDTLRCQLLLAILIVALAVPAAIALRAPAAINPAPYYAMGRRLETMMNNVDGHQYNVNFVAAVSDDITLCFPFVGIIDSATCFFGKAAVANATHFGNRQSAFTTLQMLDMWVTASSDTAPLAAVWRYMQNSVYMTGPNGTACSIQWQGFVVFRLNQQNLSQISHWLESPDAVALSSSPCVA